MPDGVLQWIDPKDGQAAVVRAGHVYAAASDDIEPVARHAGARVHFDIRRDAGVERAVDVRLRPGTRVSHHQRRYGTLAGARRPDTKGAAPFARPHSERGRMLASHPLETARRWVECLQARDVDEAWAMYAPGAVVHTPDGDLAGKSNVARYLEASEMFGAARDPDIRGENGDVVVRWLADTGDDVEVRARMEHGLIATQWIRSAPPARRVVDVADGAARVPIAVVTRGRIADPDVTYAARRIAAVIAHLDEPVLFTRLKLGLAGDPARDRPALSQVAVDINGDLVRAHVAAHTVREAADLLERRLADKVEHRARHRDDLRTRGADRQPGEWRHGDPATARPPFFDRPPDSRELVRHKTFALDEVTVEEAAFDMDQLDVDFHLFRDLASGEDAVLERTGEGRYRLARLHTASMEPATASIDVDVSPDAPPELTVADAIRRLDAGGERFVFFANAATGRGNIVYRRYDGNYGLITPA